MHKPKPLASLMNMSRFAFLNRALHADKIFGGTLIAGPYVGEFGWEVTEWQGYVRALRPHFDRTVAISYQSSAHLYDGCEFWPHGFPLEKSGYGFGNSDPEILQSTTEKCIQDLDLTDVFCFTPFDLNTMMRLSIGSQRHIVFYEPPTASGIFDIVFHFRHFERADGDSKNYPKEDANWLTEELSRRSVKMACIGHPNLAYCPPACEDRRNADLQESIRTISGATVVVGGSSAPMHLASLCDKPIVTWIGPPADGDRFFGHWNPHQAPVELVTDQSFRPDRETVLGAIESTLAAAHQRNDLHRSA